MWQPKEYKCAFPSYLAPHDRHECNINKYATVLAIFIILSYKNFYKYNEEKQTQESCWVLIFTITRTPLIKMLLPATTSRTTKENLRSSLQISIFCKAQHGTFNRTKQKTTLCTRLLVKYNITPRTQVIIKGEVEL